MMEVLILAAAVFNMYMLIGLLVFVTRVMPPTEEWVKIKPRERVERLVRCTFLWPGAFFGFTF